MATHLVVLAYNEAANIRRVLEEIAALGLDDVSTVVVNDGSTDATETIVRGMAKTMKVEILSHPRNRGIAAAFDTGLRHVAAIAAPTDAVITMEGDGTSDPAAVPAMRALFARGFDVVCASRYRAGGRYEGFPLKRRIFSVGANLAMRGYCRLPGVTDYTIFYRGYRAALLQEALARYGRGFIEARGFFANIEILLKLRRLRPLRAAETPLVYRYGLKRSGSTMRVWRNVAEYARCIARDVIARRGSSS